MKVYAATHNSDQTEGRGHTVVKAYFTELDDAILAVKNEGVMGFRDGDVYYVEVSPQVYSSYEEYQQEKNRPIDNASRLIRDNLVYDGYEQKRIPNPPVLDPEYEDYVRLRAKFGG